VMGTCWPSEKKDSLYEPFKDPEEQKDPNLEEERPTYAPPALKPEHNFTTGTQAKQGEE